MINFLLCGISICKFCLRSDTVFSEHKNEGSPRTNYDCSGNKCQ